MPRLWTRLMSLWSRRRHERDLQEELAAHLRLDVEERVHSGVPMEEARLAARREFGSVARVAEDTRAVWSWTTLEQALQDIRHGLRTLWRRPTFAIVAVTTLALSIGANTAIFSVLNAALLRPLPYPHPERLVAVYSVNRALGTPPSGVAPADFHDWREQAGSFETLAAFSGADLTSLWIGDRLEAISISRVNRELLPGV